MDKNVELIFNDKVALPRQTKSIRWINLASDFQSLADDQAESS